MSFFSSQRIFFIVGFFLVMALGYRILPLGPKIFHAPTPSLLKNEPASDGPRTNEEWRKILTPEQYHILREEGTEVPYSSALNAEKRPGTYVSADCGEPLFRSEQKYDSGTGWPSFWAPISTSSVQLKEDASFPFQTRTEVLTAKCGGHLGHVFDDGPPPTGKRYCMNGAALLFVPDAVTSTTRL